MIGHVENAKLEQFVEGNFPLNEIVKISEHIAQCGACKRKLDDLSPGFVDEAINVDSESNAVNQKKHFSDDEIYSFLKGESSVQRRLEMSDHFRFCGSCKSKLYAQDPAILNQTISTFLDTNESAKKNTFFQTTRLLVPVSALAVLLIGILSFVVFFANNGKQTVSEAQISENISDDKRTVETPKTLDTLPSNVTNKPTDSLNNNDALRHGKPTVSKPRLLKKNSSARSKKLRLKNSKIKRKTIPNKNSETIAKSRSANGNPTNSNNKVIALSPHFETVKTTQPTFRWKRVKNAVTYRLYVSDTSQILIEEAEIKATTSYKLKTKLEPGKSYRWKVIVTTSDDKTLVGKSINFSVGKPERKIPRNQ